MQSAPLIAIDDSVIERKRAASEREARLDREMDNVNVIIYTTSWCPACKQAKEWMSRNGIAYTDHDIERDKVAEKTWKRLTSTKKIPLFDIEGDTRVGFDPNWVMASRRRVAESRL